MISDPVFVLHQILIDLSLLTDEEAGRALSLITEHLSIAQVGVEIAGRHYIITVEDVSS